MLKTAIRENDPIIFLEHRQCYEMKGEVTEDPEFTVPIGKAAVKREGKDVTIVTYSYMVHFALEAAKILEQEGIDTEVVDLRTIKPMDTETVLNSVKKTHRVLCLQETWLTCGVAGEVAAVIADLAFDYLDAPVKRMGSPDCPAPFSPDLETYVLPSVNGIVQAVRELME